MDVIEQARPADLLSPRETPSSAQLTWFGPALDQAAPRRWGFRTTPGGVHLSKTMMLAELTALFNAASSRTECVQALVLDTNVLGKRTGAARRLALARLNTLYGVQKPNPLTAVLAKLWHRRADGRPLLALLCALAREPLLRDSAGAVLPASPGAPRRWPQIAMQLEGKHPGRYSPKMLKSLAQNCASTWTQAGHLTLALAVFRRAILTP